MKLYDAVSPSMTRSPPASGGGAITTKTNRSRSIRLSWDHLRHLRESGRMVMATSDDGQPAGFGGIVERSGVTRLADLFIDPEHQGQGLGQALLHEMLDAKTVMTTSPRADPRALPLYTRAGMQPLWPYHFVVGDPRRVTAPADGHRRARD